MIVSKKGEKTKVNRREYTFGEKIHFSWAYTFQKTK